jgi:hypothetical protein
MAAKLGTEKIQQINDKLNKYIDTTDIPIIAEFAYENNLRRQLLYENEVLSDTIKKAVDKKEAQLERKALDNDINTTFAIFSLKQLGWKDKQEIDHTIQGKLVINRAGSEPITKTG